MAYSIGGKIYTENAMLDEVTSAVKIILESIILKNEKKADNCETASSMENADILLAIDNGSIRLSLLPMSRELLVNFGYNNDTVNSILAAWASGYGKDRVDAIPEEDRQSLFEFATQWFLDHFEEENDYYRMINGLPEYGTGKNFYVYIKAEDYPNITDLATMVDLSKPVHEYSVNDINTIEALGILNDIKQRYVDGSHYLYLNYLGSMKIDIITARKAKRWDILYIPTVESVILDRFKEIYQINRDIYLKMVYQPAYIYNSDYYDEMVMFMILCQTFTDVLADIPEWYIRRDVFDLRTCQFFLESQGVQFFKQIPLKYQIKIVRNLNKLIRYKSTTHNVEDILEIFGAEGTTVYKYYIYKKIDVAGANIIIPDAKEDPEWYMPGQNYEYGDEGVDEHTIPESAPDSIDCLDRVGDAEYEKDEDGNYLFHIYDFKDESASDVIDDGGDKEEQQEANKIYMDEYGNTYKLEFIRVPLDESYDKYIKDNTYIDDYDYITLEDEYWDGEDVHSYVKNKHLAQDFTVAGTKYMFLENKVSMSEYMHQVCYFNNMIFTSRYDTEDITISVPSIKNNTEYSLRDLCMLLYVLSQEFLNLTLKIKRPDPSSGEIIDGFTMSDDDYDWVKKNHPDWFYDTSTTWIYAFNLTADLDALQQSISCRHSSWDFNKTYTLEDFGVENFKIATDFNTIEEMVDVYRINTEAYNNLVHQMTNHCYSRDKKVLMDHIFHELFMMPYDEEFYTLSDGTPADTYDQLLRDKNYSLYDFYTRIMAEEDEETRKDNIREALNTIIDTLEYYLDTEDTKWVFGYVPTTSLDAINEYITLMINYFKSWKVHFLDPHSTYVIDSALENKVNAVDNMFMHKDSWWYYDSANMRDSIVSYVDAYYYDDRIEWYDDIEIEERNDWWNTDPFDFDGGYPENNSVRPNPANESPVIRLGVTYTAGSPFGPEDYRSYQYTEVQNASSIVPAYVTEDGAFVPQYPDSFIYFDILTDIDIYTGGDAEDDSTEYAVFDCGTSVTLDPSLIDLIIRTGDSTEDVYEGTWSEYRNLNGGLEDEIDHNPWWMIDGGLETGYKYRAKDLIYDRTGTRLIARDAQDAITELNTNIDGVGIWAHVIQCRAGDTSCIVYDSKIKTSSVIEIYNNESGMPIKANIISIANKQVKVSFRALKEDMGIKLCVMNP